MTRTLAIILTALALLTSGIAEAQKPQKPLRPTRPQPTQPAKPTPPTQQQPTRPNKPNKPTKPTRQQTQPTQQPAQPVKPTTGTIGAHEYVDLALPSGLKWATCNVGATNSRDYGSYFAWGETSPKNDYSESNSRTYNQQISQFAGNSSYDAAVANWGAPWRMPTKAEFEELLANCTYRWTGDGAEFTSKHNQAKIYFPAAGWRNGTGSYYQGSDGRYWSASPHSVTVFAWCLYFYDGGPLLDFDIRYHGLPVRPVAK